MKLQGTPFNNEISSFFYEIQEFNPTPNIFECVIAKIVDRAPSVSMSYFHYYRFFFHIHPQHQLPTPHEESKANFIFLQNFEIATIHELTATHTTTDFQQVHTTNRWMWLPVYLHNKLFTST